MDKVPKNFSPSSATSTVERNTDQDFDNKEDVIKDEDGMPTLVVKLFIESITEVELLKKLRLVNKYWNFEACHSLRKLSITTLCSRTGYINLIDGLGGENLDQFHSVLDDGTTLSLPSPFQQFTLLTTTVPGHILSSLFNRFGLEIKSLDVAVSRVDDLNQLRIFLKEYSNQITKLTLPKQWSQLHEAYDDLALPALQSLNCKNDHQSSAHLVDFVKTILFNGSAVTTFKMYIRSASNFSMFLSLDLTKIQTLELVIFQYNLVQSWDALATVQLPSVKVLKVMYVADTSFYTRPKYVPHFHSLLNNIAPSLEDLVTSGPYNIWNAINMFPKLKSLTQDFITPDDLDHFTHERFPSLKEIKIKTVCIGSENQMEIDCVPHEGVEKISIQNCYIEARSLYEENQRIETWLITLTRKFPNVQHVTMFTIERNFASFCCQQFNRAYPKLNFLKLRGPMELDEVASYCGPSGITSYAIARTPTMFCVQNFQNLESLVLQSHVVSVTTIKHYVAWIPKLKYLRMPWCKQLSVEIFRDSLQHLEVLEISNFNQWRNILTQLKAVMPRTLIKARLDVMNYE